MHTSKYKINYCPGCVMFIDVACFLMCVLFYFSFVCLHVFAYAIVQGPLQECLRAARFRASLLVHTTCVRSCCNWRSNCVATKQNQKKSREGFSSFMTYKNQ